MSIWYEELAQTSRRGNGTLGGKTNTTKANTYGVNVLYSANEKTIYQNSNNHYFGKYSRFQVQPGNFAAK